MHKLSFNLQKTKAVIIANSDYTFFPAINPAVKNADKITELLEPAVRFLSDTWKTCSGHLPNSHQ